MSDNKQPSQEELFLNTSRVKDDIVHADELSTVIKFDEIGKRYGIYTADSLLRRNVPEFITFHTGNPNEGINGISLESLLAVCKDRLETFNKNGFQCEENDIAIECCLAAIESLQARQQRRREENKLGTQEK